MTLQIRSAGHPAQQNQFRQSIEIVLQLIRRTATGRIVLFLLEMSSRRVVIEPFGRADLAESGHNAYAMPGSEAAAGTFGAGEPAAGTGSFVHFTPGVVVSSSPQGSDDEVLLHELCHSLRQVSGAERHSRDARGARVPTPMVSFESIEEFFAAMVTSVHSSELGRRPLGNHDAAGLPDPDILSRPPYSTRLHEIAARMPQLTQQLALIPAEVAAFNPFRDYVN